MTIDVNVYHHFPETTRCDEIMGKILTELAAIKAQGAQIMTKAEELETELAAANATTNEIAADIDAILAQLAGGVSATEADALKVKLQEHQAALRAVADKHTPPTP